MDTTEHLLSTDKNKKRLMESTAQVKSDLSRINSLLDQLDTIQNNLKAMNANMKT